MNGTIYDVLECVVSPAFASVENFVLGPGKPVSASIGIETGWSLYSFDFETQTALFVELPLELDLSQSAFTYMDQCKYAIRLLQVPMADLADLAAQIPEAKKVIFVFNIGRCGSTLACNVLNELPEVWCLSEPDAYSRLLLEDFLAKSRVIYPRDQAVQLIQQATRLLFRPPPGQDETVFAVKFRSQSLFQADLYYEAFPDASFVFLYRDALNWSDSVYQMVRKFGAPADTPREECGVLWDIFTAASGREKLLKYVDIDTEVAPMEDALSPAWAFAMDTYSAHLNAGVPFMALRYNELNSDRQGSLRSLFAHCGLPPDRAVSFFVAFEKDSQQGTPIARDIVAERLSDAQKAKLTKILTKHPRFGDADMILPDIYYTKVS